MRKHLSVFMLLARSSIFKVIGLLAAMAAVQGALFYAGLRAGPPGLEAAIGQSRIALSCAGFFLVLCTFLCLTGCQFGARQGYTLRRLRLSERTVFIWQALYNTLCFLIFWAAQLMIIWALSRLYLERLAPDAGGQALFLAFYREPFMHSLLPLAETSRTVRNIVFALSLGVAAACFPLRQRRGRKGVAAGLLAAAAVVAFRRVMGSFGSDLFTSLAFIVVAAFAAVGAWEEPEDGY